MIVLFLYNFVTENIHNASNLKKNLCTVYLKCSCRQETLGLIKKTAPSAASAMETTRSHANRGSAALHKSAKLLKEYWDAIPQVKLTNLYDTRKLLSRLIVFNFTYCLY